VGDLEFLLLLLLGAAALVRGAAALHVPYPIALVLTGLGIGFVPGLPEVRLEGEVLLVVFLPPLLAAAGLDAARVRADVEAGTFAERVARDVDSGRAAGAPAFFVNGTPHEGGYDAQSLIAALEGR